MYTLTESNIRLLRKWYEFDPHRGSINEPWENHVWNYAIVNGRRKVWIDEELKPLPHELYRLSFRFWETYFPSHCRGDTILYPASRIFYDGLNEEDNLFIPVIIVSCNHFEYGDSLVELNNLYTFTKFVGLELFNKDDVETTIALLHPNIQVLILLIEPSLSSSDMTMLVKHSPFEAINYFKRIIRRSRMGATY